MMNRILLFSLLFAAAGFAFGAEPMATASADEKAGFSESQLREVELRLATITDPAAKLFFKTAVEWAKGEQKMALQTVSELIVHHAHDERWIARGELLSAALYAELGMMEAADVTARQVQALYSGTVVAETATALRTEIERLNNETEAKRSVK